MSYFGNNRCRGLPLLHVIPVHSQEQSENFCLRTSNSVSLLLLVILDVMRAAVSVAQSFLALTHQQLLYEVLHDEVDRAGPGDFAQEDRLVDGEASLDEGRVAHEELVCEYPEPPPVDTLVVPLLQDDLWRHVVRGPALRPAPLVLGHLAGEAEVCQHDVTLLVQQEVLRFQVSVDDVVPVEVGEGCDDLCDVEEGRLQGELPVTPEVGEQFTSAYLQVRSVTFIP